MARVYRLARVISHVMDEGRAVIEAEVPRRLMERVLPQPGTRGAR